MKSKMATNRAIDAIQPGTAGRTYSVWFHKLFVCNTYTQYDVISHKKWHDFVKKNCFSAQLEIQNDRQYDWGHLGDL